MSCPYASSSAGSKRMGVGGTCPVTGASKRMKVEGGSGRMEGGGGCLFAVSSSSGSEEEGSGCYVSRSGGLDISLHDQLHHRHFPLNNIPQFLTIFYLKDLLKASKAINDINWDEIYFCKFDSLAPLPENVPLEELDIQNGLHMTLKTTRPLFIQVSMNINGRISPISLDFIPPWITTDTLKQIVLFKIPSLSSFLRHHNYKFITSDGCLLADGLKLDTLGPILDLKMEKL